MRAHEHLFPWLLLLLFGAVPAVDDEPETPRCNTCKHVGRRPCKEHKLRDVELETNVLYCSHFDDCEVCGGAGWLDCDDCGNEVAESWLSARRLSQRLGKEALEEELDAQMGRKLLKAESDHFIVVWDIEKMKVGKQMLKDHELLHLQVDRFETLFDDYLAALDAGEADFSRKSQVFVWWLPKDQKEASLRFCENANENGVKLLGSTPRYSVCGSKQRFKSDEDLHRNLVHNVTHILFSHQAPTLWIGNRKGGWADAGLAHWFEDKYFGVCTNYCYQEQNSNQDFKGGKWRPAVRKMVAKGDHPPVAEVFAQNTDTLSLEHHALSFSYVDFLLEDDGAKANQLFRRMRGRTETREAFRDVLGESPLEFEVRWKAWVLETYPRR